MSKNTCLYVVRGIDYNPDGTRNFVIIRGSYEPSKLGERQINDIIREQYEHVVGKPYNSDSLVIRTYNIKGISKHRGHGHRHIVDIRASVPDDDSGDKLRERIEAAFK